MNNKKLALIMEINTTEGFLKGSSVKYITEPQNAKVKTLGDMVEMIEKGKANGHILTYKLEMVNVEELGMGYTRSADGIVYRIEPNGNSTLVEGGAF